MAILYIFAGLPGAGKTALAQRLAERLQAVYIRIDTIEQALRDMCGIAVQGEGYGLAYRVAADNLRLGLSVVADSCNPIEMTRRQWESVARASQAQFIDIEVICSDKREHRKRIQSRKPSIASLKLPTWEEVERRNYDTWTRERIEVDTSGRTESESFEELLSNLL